MSKIGAHVSIAQGLQNAPLNAATLGCEFFQFFSKSPRGGKAKEITSGVVYGFLKVCAEKGFTPWKSSVIHSAYFINLASTNNRIFHGSITSLKQELETANLLKVPFVVTHIGSAKDHEGNSARESAINQVERGLSTILEDYNGRSQLLLEIAAGSGNIMGDTIEELAYFTNKFEKLGFCMDTCHSFAAGYDLRSKEQVVVFFAEMDEKIGLEKLKVIHLNDSMTDFASNVDRHDHLGKGKIGIEGLTEVIRIATQRKIPMIIETKHEGISSDLKLAKDIRASFYA